MGPGTGDGFRDSVKHSLACAQLDVLSQVNAAVNNSVQICFLDQLAGQLVGAHEAAVKELQSQNKELRRRLATSDEAKEFSLPQRSPASPGPFLAGSWTLPSPALARSDTMDDDDAQSWASGDHARPNGTDCAPGPGSGDAEVVEAAVAGPSQAVVFSPRNSRRSASPEGCSRAAAPQLASPGTSRPSREPADSAPSDRLSTDQIPEEPTDGATALFNPFHQNSSHFNFNKIMESVNTGLRNSAMTAEEELVVDPNSPSAIIVRSRCFETFFSTVIIANCATMGVEAHLMVKEQYGDSQAAMDVLEHIFTTLFSVELLLRLRVYGWRAFLPTKAANIWNTLDFILVVFTGIIFGWVMPLVARVLGLTTNDGFIRTLTVLRAVRLLRVVRVIREVQVFREVWLLLKGLTDSMRILVWTCIVIFFVTYMFAVFGLWMISKEIAQLHWSQNYTSVEQATELEMIHGWVGGLDRICRTLIQFLTLDSWNQKVETMMKYQPWCWVYFYAYIAVAVFVLMNLVTAIIVENAMATSRLDADHQLQEKEQELKKELNDIKCLFHMMDADGDGQLDWDEFQAAFEDEYMLKRWRLLDINPTDCRELFELLDDGDGGIDTEEFFNGLSNMKGVAQSKDIVKLSKKLDRQENRVCNIANALGLRRGKKDRLSSGTSVSRPSGSAMTQQASLLSRSGFCDPAGQATRARVNELLSRHRASV